MNVGYFYLNHNFSNRLAKDFPGLRFTQAMPICEAIELISASPFTDKMKVYFGQHFPERSEDFEKYGVTALGFEESNHKATNKLSPGFMGNPPDRLDGFHDYCLNCRKKNDPGRHDDNMRTYSRDRRTFEWWAEGNWALADALYNSAGPGQCGFEGCATELEKVSPDHVGPLACGFKQLPLFVPSCQKHNSAKNRRFSHSDVVKLIDYEKSSKASVASWQVRAHWNSFKFKIKNDNEAKVLSNSLRSLQDMYFRVLRRLLDVGKERFIATFLSPEFAIYDFDFVNLDRGALTFDSYSQSENTSELRLLQRARVLRIAFEAIKDYTDKKIEKRKMIRSDYDDNRAAIDAAIVKISALSSNADKDWVGIFDTSHGQEAAICKLLDNHLVPEADWDKDAKAILKEVFDTIGSEAIVDFSRYGTS